MPPSLRADTRQLSSWLRSVTDGNEQLCCLLPSIQRLGGGSGGSYSCLPGVTWLAGKRNGRAGTSLPEKSGDVDEHTEVGLGLLRDLQHESGNQFVTLSLIGEISDQTKLLLRVQEIRLHYYRCSRVLKVVLFSTKLSVTTLKM